MIELTEKDILRFWSKVDIKSEDECWEWLGCKDKNGYGQFGVDKKIYKSHRISWILANGQIPKDNSGYGTMLICHTCDNTFCQNPNHLFLGTQKDNIDDKVNKYRQVYGEKNGRHKLTEKEVLEIKQKYIPRIYTQKQLAEEYGISRQQIQRIVNNKRWTYL